MSALSKLREWLTSFPGNNKLQSFEVDYYSEEPGAASLAPTGLVEISRKQDILGKITIENQYNFALYYAFAKDGGSAENADWLINLQEWIQEQSVLGKVPAFGDEPDIEEIKAQNGSIFGATEEGVAVYMVQLSVNFIKVL